MYLIKNIVRSTGEKNYSYYRLAESYREGGVSKRRILGNLGSLTSKAEQNLRVALQATREGKAVIIAADTPGLCDAAKVQANLRYLDIAVLLEIWRFWGLDGVYRELIEDGEDLVIKIRPIYHYTDPKVQAHVTICMLSLLLQRTLERLLRMANIALSSKACLETLGTCHLNLMKPLPGGHHLYSVTEATTTQREILNALDIAQLVDDKAVSRKITPRFVPT